MAKPDYIAKSGSPLDRPKSAGVTASPTTHQAPPILAPTRVITQDELRQMYPPPPETDLHAAYREARSERDNAEAAAKHRKRLAKQREYQRAYRTRVKAAKAGRG